MTTAFEIPNPDWRPEGWDAPGHGIDDGAAPAGWLPADDLAVIRAQLPIVYINAVPVRLDDSGDVTQVGLLLRMGGRGLTRSLVAGRVLYHERVRDAVKRLVEHDIGPMSLPIIPPSPQPFTVAEYLPTPGITPFFDHRQHAVALCYVIPITGDCRPRDDALQIDWITPEGALTPEILRSFTDGQDVLLKQAIAYLGRLS
ncbi:MAG: NUDIX hydrolase family protein [Promicromonosporaceae bacterium]|nr:NUDIX hydrolase family protein [Promicromonosporaceae bacterium]